ncbi:MAG: prolipoprotein diacylglyceryl transferase [bacterium]|nr:prolipoprotein diacylglyceryl transferase [bacterium]
MDRVFISFLGFNIYWYSVLIIAGIIVGYYLIIKEAKRIGIDTTFVNDLVFYLVPISILGGRLYYVIFNLSAFSDNILSILYIWEGGLAIYGAVIAGALFIIYYSSKKKQDAYRILDLVVPSVILGQAIGRWGNYFNSEAYGPITTRNFLENLHLPNFIIDGMYINGHYYQPTFLYESLWCLLGFCLLLLIRYLIKKKETGVMLSFYFIWYGIGRFLIEGLREDSLYFYTFRVSQIVSVILIIIGVILIFLRKTRNRYLQ